MMLLCGSTVEEGVVVEVEEGCGGWAGLKMEDGVVVVLVALGWWMMEVLVLVEKSRRHAQ